MNVIITGAANGLGAALTDILRTRGHQIGRLDIDLPDGPITLEEGGWAQRFDVADAASWEVLAAELGERDWHPDALINNAGIGTYGAIKDLDVSLWERQLAVSLTGPWLGLKFIVPILNDGGRVLNIGSRRGLTVEAERTAYSASKFGLRGMTLAAALELHPLKVGILELDSMMTDFAGSLDDRRRRAERGEPILDPEAVAALIADLLEEKRPWQTEARVAAGPDGPVVTAVADQS